MNAHYSVDTSPWKKADIYSIKRYTFQLMRFMPCVDKIDSVVLEKKIKTKDV